MSGLIQIRKTDQSIRITEYPCSKPSTYVPNIFSPETFEHVLYTPDMNDTYTTQCWMGRPAGSGTGSPFDIAGVCYAARCQRKIRLICWKRCYQISAQAYALGSTVPFTLAVSGIPPPFVLFSGSFTTSVECLVSAFDIPSCLLDWLPTPVLPAGLDVAGCSTSVSNDEYTKHCFLPNPCHQDPVLAL